MKLASYDDGSRDGLLVVVSRDLSMAHHAAGIASRLQQVLDDWGFLSPQLEDLSVALNQGRARHAFAFDPRRCLAPLPRSFQRVAASAYGVHLERLGQPGGGPVLLRQASGDALGGPCEEIRADSDRMGIDFGAEIGVITGDLPRGADAEEALEGVRLLVLANEVRLRHLPAGGPAAYPGTFFAPVAVTPDELGTAWSGGRLQLPLQLQLNGKRFAKLDAGADMDFHFGELLSQLCRTRRVRAGSIVSSGTVSNREAQQGAGCLAEKQALAPSANGAEASVPAYLRQGDSLRIEIRNAEGQSVFGAIEQSVELAG